VRRTGFCSKNIPIHRYRVFLNDREASGNETESKRFSEQALKMLFGVKGFRSTD
jgi:hypothetical protein